jgi:O-antigen/teichoic acid export membrane protein
MSEELNRSLTSVAKGAGIIFTGMMAGNILGMVNQIILGRFLGPDMYGLFNLALSVVMIASTLALFGFFGSLSRFIPFHLKQKEIEKVRGVIDFSMIFVLSNGIIFATALFLLAGQISVGIFKEPELEGPLKLFAIGIPILSIQQVLRGIVRGFKEAKLDALLFNVGDRIIKVGFFFISLLFIYRLYGAIASYIVGALVTGIVAIWMIAQRIFREYRTTSRAPVAKEILAFSWPLALTGFSFLFVTKTDKILLGYYLTKHEVGIFSPALVIAGMLIFVTAAFKYIFLPTVSEYFSRNDISSLERLFKSTSKWIFLVVLPLFLVILIFPKEIITMLYGSNYVEGYLALVILSFGIAMNDFSGTAGNILVGGGHTKLNLACEMIAAITNIVFAVILIPRYGINGAAAATGISYMTRNISSVSFVYKTFGIHPYKASYFRIMVAGLVTTGIVYGLKVVSPFSWLVSMLLLGIIFILIYLTMIVIMRSLDQNDKVVLEALENKSGLNLGFIKKFI